MASFGLNTQSFGTYPLVKTSGTLYGGNAGAQIFATQAGEFGSWDPFSMSLEDSPIVQNVAQGHSVLSVITQDLNAQALPNFLENGLDILTYDQGGRKELDVLGRLETQLLTIDANTPATNPVKTDIARQLSTINAYQKGLKINEYVSKRATSIVMTELTKERQVASILRSNETNPLSQALASAELTRRNSVVQSLQILAQTTEVGLYAATLTNEDPQQADVIAAYQQLGAAYDQLEMQRFDTEAQMGSLAKQLTGQEGSLAPNLPMLGRVTRMAGHIALLDELDDLETENAMVSAFSTGAQAALLDDGTLANLSQEINVLKEWENNDSKIDSVIDRNPNQMSSLQLAMIETQRRSQYFTVAELKNHINQLDAQLLGTTGDYVDPDQVMAQRQMTQSALGQVAQIINQLYMQAQSFIGQFG